MSRVKKSPLTKWFLFTMVAFMTFGTLFIYNDEDVGMYADASNYEPVDLPMRIPTAYHDYNANLGNNEASDGASTQLENLLLEHFGNTGLLVGPRDGSSTSSNLGTYHNPNSISLAPSELYAMDISLAAIRSIQDYHVFGRAVNEISDRGKGMTSSATNATDSLDVVANTATGVSRAGMKILIDYSPGPLIKQLYTGERAVAQEDSSFVEADGTIMKPGYRLINMVEGNVIGELWEALSIKPLGDGVPVTLTTLILAIVVILLVIGSVVMTIFGGRAGESIKKALVRVVIASVAIPLMGMMLHWGLTGAAAVTDYDISQEERDARHQIGQHLNLAGWAATGFRVPEGLSLKIVDGKFDLTQSDIRILNIMSHYIKTGGEGAGSSMTKEDLEAIPDDDGYFNATDIYADMQNMAKDNKNKTSPHFKTRPDGDAIEVSSIASIIGSTGETSGGSEDGDDDGDDEGDGEEEEEPEVETDTGKVSYINKAEFTNTIEKDGREYTIYGGQGKFGMSPISAYHMMYSDFSGDSIKAKRSNRPFTSVVYHASNGKGGTNSDGSESGTGMNGIIKFIAIMTVSIASLKGLGQIVMGGFGGIIAGTARSSVGSSAGFGQAIGGVIALVGGVIGMSFIINISFELLDALYDIINYLFNDIDGGKVMEPISDAVQEAMPWGFGWIGDMFVSLTTFIVSLVAMLALPKFGAIPIDMFSAKMAELPGNMSERAQQMENRFTGDFRGGGGGGGGGRGVGSGVSSALSGATGQAKGLGQAGAAGAGMALGIAGMGLSKVANRNNKEGDKSKNESMSNSENNTEGGDGPEGDNVENSTESESMSFSDVDAQDTTSTDSSNETNTEGADSELTSEQESISDDSTEIEGSSDEFESTDETHGADEENVHEQAGGEQNTIQQTDSVHDESSEHSQAGADNSSLHEATSHQDGGEKTNDSVHEQAGAETDSTVDSTHEQSGGTQESIQNNQQHSDVKSESSKESSSQSTSQSKSQNTTQNKSDSVSHTEAGESVSGEGASGTGNSPSGAHAGPASAGQTVNAGKQSDKSGQAGQGKQSGPSVRNENKTHNQNNSSMNANATVGGSTTIDKSVDKPTSGDGTSLADKGKGNDNAPDSGEKVYAKPPTRGQRMMGAIKKKAKHQVSRETIAKRADGLGKGMQAAGGEVSLKRAGAAILHAGASTGGIFQEKTKGTLDRASGKEPQKGDKKNVDTNKNKQQQQKQQDSVNEQAMYRAEQERQENDRNKPRK